MDHPAFNRIFCMNEWFISFMNNPGIIEIYTSGGCSVKSLRATVANCSDLVLKMKRNFNKEKPHRQFKSQSL